MHCQLSNKSTPWLRGIAALLLLLLLLLHACVTLPPWPFKRTLMCASSMVSLPCLSYSSMLCLNVCIVHCALGSVHFFMVCTNCRFRFIGPRSLKSPVILQWPGRPVYIGSWTNGQRMPTSICLQYSLISEFDLFSCDCYAANRQPISGVSGNWPSDGAVRMFILKCYRMWVLYTLTYTYSCRSCTATQRIQSVCDRNGR